MDTELVNLILTAAIGIWQAIKGVRARRERKAARTLYASLPAPPPLPPPPRGSGL